MGHELNAKRFVTWVQDFHSFHGRRPTAAEAVEHGWTGGIMAAAKQAGFTRRSALGTVVLTAAGRELAAAKTTLVIAVHPILRHPHQRVSRPHFWRTDGTLSPERTGT